MHELVEEVEQVGSGVGNGGPLRLHRRVVAASDGSLSDPSGPSSARFSTVRRSRGTSSAQGLVGGESRARGDALRRGLEGDEEVRGHRCGGVVGGASLVVDLERGHAEPAREVGRKGERLGAGAGDRATRSGKSAERGARRRDPGKV